MEIMPKTKDALEKYLNEQFGVEFVHTQPHVHKICQILGYDDRINEFNRIVDSLNEVKKSIGQVDTEIHLAKMEVERYIADFKKLVSAE